MVRSFFIFLLVILSCSSVIGQETKSVIRLKNGVFLKGEIIEFVKDDYMILHVMDGQDMRIPAEYIKSFKIKKGKLVTYDVPKPGYFNYTSTGLIFLKGDDFDAVEVHMSVHTVNGYRLDEHHYAGLGLGYDRYGLVSSLPVYLSLHRDLKSNKVTPTFSGSIGYGWMWEDNSYYTWGDFDEVKGGLYWELGAGLRINYRKTAMIIKYAYKRQNSKLTSTGDFWWRAENTVVERHNYRNMALTIGMEF